MNLEDEADSITKLLKGKVVSVVWRHRDNELVIQFVDGSRLFVDSKIASLEVSITGGAVDNDAG